MRYLLLLLSLVCLFLPASLIARQSGKSIELIAYLNELRDEHAIDLAYDPDLLTGFTIEKPQSEEDLSGKLELLNLSLPLSFELIDGSYLIVKTKPVNLKLTTIDANTSEAIPGVYIKKNGSYAQLVSDPVGNIDLTTEWKKSDSLSFEFLGYDTYKIAIRDLLIRKQKTIVLSEGNTVLNELVINGYLGNGISANQQNHSLNIKTEDLGMLPGDTNKDLLVSLRSLPGITTMTGRAGELRVRGGTPDQTLLLFNNIPIYHKGYYYGTISPFSTDIVDEVRVYRSGFTSRLGGRVGGAIEITSDTDIPEKTAGGFATSSVYASAYLKTALTRNKLGLTISGRTSHPFEYQSPIEKEYEEMVIAASLLTVSAARPEVERDPLRFDFWDINGSLNYRPDANNQLAVNFLTINNDNNIRIVDNRLNDELRINTILNNNGFNAEWSRKMHNWNNQLFVTGADYLYQTEAINTSTIDGRRLRYNFQDNGLRTIRVGNILTYTNPETFNALEMGYEMTNLRSTLSIELIQAPRPGGDRPTPPDAPPNPLPQEGTVHSVFSSYKITEWNKFMFDLGLRSNYYTKNKSLRLEPRVFLNYFASDKFTIKSSAGYYSQFITRNVFFNNSDLPLEKLLWQLVINREQEIIKSRQFLIGAVHQSAHWIFDVDLYYKEVENITTNGPMIPGPNVPSRLIGSIKSRGMDLLVKRRIRSVDIWGTYTLSKTDMNFPRLKTTDFPANYDQRHIVNLASSYQKNRFRASLGWIWSSGIPDFLDDPFFPATGPRVNELPPPTPTGEVERFDPVHQLDASVAYHFFTKNDGAKITVGLSFLNLYNNDNLLEIVNVSNGRGFEGSTASNRYTIGFAPDIMLKIDF